MADNHEVALARAAALARTAVENQASEPEHDAIVTLWIMARSLLRILNPIVTAKGFDAQ